MSVYDTWVSQKIFLKNPLTGPAPSHTVPFRVKRESFVMTDEITYTGKEFYEVLIESELGRRWIAWNEENPEFYRLFEKFTFQAISRGHSRLSGWLIANRVRWETTVVTTGDDYKISNDFIALFTRFFMVKNPEYIGFFRTKKMKRLQRDVFSEDDSCLSTD